MSSEDIMNKDQQYVLPNYGRYNLALVRGSGAYAYDAEGKEYLDFLAGISVCNFGHCNERINTAVKEQLDKLIHTSNLYYTENQGELARLISEISFPGRTFFGNSGTEANEAALKLIRFRGNNISQGKNVVLSLVGSFHGRSTGSLALTGQSKHQEGFEPLLPNVFHVKINDINDLRDNFNSDVAGIFLEPIQGESGIHPLTEDFVREARALCDEHNALLIFDEIQTGLGRTGTYFGYEHYAVEPDGFTLAKSLANGIPIGAFHIKEKYKDDLPPGKHASTFGGNPLACRAGVEVIRLLTDGLMDKLSAVSQLLFQKLNALKEEYPVITEIRGLGLMVALELSVNARDVLNSCHEEGLLCNAIGESVIRLLPPLIITDKEVELFYEKMSKALSKSHQGGS
ncbi:MAG: aspartate aminotransferase family protein [Spirochaetota bacterium]|nr:aspartate aminotransferase family protein [Spirochaetota bacterium]